MEHRAVSRQNVRRPPWNIGPVDFFDHAQLARPEILVAASAAEIKQRIGPTAAGKTSAQPVDPPLLMTPVLVTPVLMKPVLVKKGHRGYNVVRFKGMYIALAQSAGPVDLMQVDDPWLERKRLSRELFIGETLVEAVRQIDEFAKV